VPFVAKEDGMVNRRQVLAGSAFLVGLHVLGTNVVHSSAKWQPPKSDYEDKTIGEILLYVGKKLVLPVDGVYKLSLTEDFDLFALVGDVGKAKNDTAAIVFSSVRVHKNPSGDAYKNIYVNKLDDTVTLASQGNTTSTNVFVSLSDYENWHSGTGDLADENSADKLIASYHANLQVNGSKINTSEFKGQFLLPATQENSEYLTRASTLLRFAQGGPRQFDTGGFINDPIRAYVRIFAINCEFDPVEIVLHQL
jgi:hypothetical protein